MVAIPFVIVRRSHPLSHLQHHKKPHKQRTLVPASSKSVAMMTSDQFELPDGAHLHERDVPLTFWWLTPQDAIDSLGLPQARNSRHQFAQNAIASEAARAAEIGHAVSYSRRRAFYVGRRRYFGNAFSYTNVLAAVADGVAADLLTEERALPGSRGIQSRFRATPLLSRSLKALPKHRPPRETIWLRDDQGRLIDYSDCELTNGLRRVVEAINRELQTITVTFQGADVRKEDGRWVIGETHYFSAPPRLRRVFSRASFEMGGRAYGPWQALPARHRALMLINGEQTLEPDFAALHPSIIYALRGIRLIGDPYETANFPRDYGKKAFNVAVNAKIIFQCPRRDRS